MGLQLYFLKIIKLSQEYDRTSHTNFILHSRNVLIQNDGVKQDTRNKI